MLPAHLGEVPAPLPRVEGQLKRETLPRAREVMLPVLSKLLIRPRVVLLIGSTAPNRQGGGHPPGSVSLSRSG